LFNMVHKIYPTVSSSQIIPVVVGSAQKTNQLAKNLRNSNYYVLPINPPTVPLNTSRLRISLCSDIKEDEIKDFFKKVKDETFLA